MGTNKDFDINNISDKDKVLMFWDKAKNNIAFYDMIEKKHIPTCKIRFSQDLKDIYECEDWSLVKNKTEIKKLISANIFQL